MPFIHKGVEIGSKVAPYAISAAKTLLPLLLAAGMSEADGARMIEEHGLDKTVRKLTKRVGSGGMMIGGKTCKKRGGKLTTKSEMSRYLTDA